MQGGRAAARKTRSTYAAPPTCISSHAHVRRSDLPEGDRAAERGLAIQIVANERPSPPRGRPRGPHERHARRRDRLPTDFATARRRCPWPEDCRTRSASGAWQASERCVLATAEVPLKMRVIRFRRAQAGSHGCGVRGRSRDASRGICCGCEHANPGLSEPSRHSGSSGSAANAHDGCRWERHDYRAAVDWLGLSNGPRKRGQSRQRLRAELRPGTHH
jgi:hypothetical protein